MKRGEIYLLYTNKHGNIQAGYRPVIIVQNDLGNQCAPTTIVCSITSAQKKALPTHLPIGKQGNLKKDSIILCEQIKTVCKTDLKQYIGFISDQTTLEQLDNKILISLGVIK